MNKKWKHQVSVKKSLLAIALITAVAHSVITASAATVLPGDPAWASIGNSGGGSSAVTATAPRSGNGSLELTGDRTRFTGLGNPFDASSNLGLLSSITDFRFEWSVAVGSSQGATPDYSPALRLHIWDGAQRSELIWENAYNGPTPVVQGSWYSSGSADNFWRFETGIGDSLIYNRTISQWSSLGYSVNAYVAAISVGVGSAAAATYHAFADNVVLDFGAGPTTYNFEAFAADQDCPIISNIQPTLVPINTLFDLTANVDDTTTGGSTIVSASYSIDNGTPVGMTASDGNFDGINEDVKATLSIAAAGVYNVCVSAIDSAGNTCEECILLVVYDPSAGFVTGGGWINSPAGAYVEDGLLEGRANFGFVSKYKKGATAPDGTTEFQFQAGGLNFHSSSYQWLVVNNNGQNAQFKGGGTINGAGNYGFMIWAYDGAKTATPDTFRIQIWDKDNGDAIIYDNVVNQTLGGGNIVIHVPKK